MNDINPQAGCLRRHTVGGSVVERVSSFLTSDPLGIDCVWIRSSPDLRRSESDTLGLVITTYVVAA